MVRTLLPLVAALSSATSLHAARLTVMKGDALVSHGDGYESVRDAADLFPGDTVVTRAGSSAKVTFKNGCTIRLGIGIVFSVPAEAPCGDASAASTASPTASGGFSETSALATQDWSAVTQTTVAPEASQFDALPYLLGATAIGGISAAAFALSGGGGSPPASP
ncbi:hypothetical protein [Hyphomicrobium sp. MC1]|uniref:hypothetical protein n=1 Tax=Hyphomicrobium sp. (strain MC1) TaxID=717785 RepID=UPI000213DD57|nr:hypothetical protein [Hyphomicrobium sp. MC1]CCB66363.1 conserved exported protein of unknown function [Hyphomicrobium sp. MC1]